MNLGRCRTGEKVEDQIASAPPVVFEDKSGKPEKPHVADKMQPTDVQEIAGEVGDGGGMGGHKAVTSQKRVSLEGSKSLRQAIHFRLEFRWIVDLADIGIPRVFRFPVG